MREYTVGTAAGIKYDDTFGTTTRTIKVKRVYAYSDTLPDARDINNLVSELLDGRSKLEVIDRTTITHIVEYER